MSMVRVLGLLVWVRVFVGFGDGNAVTALTPTPLLLRKQYLSRRELCRSQREVARSSNCKQPLKNGEAFFKENRVLSSAARLV